MKMKWGAPFFNALQKRYPIISDVRKVMLLAEGVHGDEQERRVPMYGIQFVMAYFLPVGYCVE